MVPVKPKIALAGDSPSKIEARKGFIIGYDARRVVWKFGFLPGSDEAKAFGVSVAAQTYVLAKTDGTVRKEYTGTEASLPEDFKNVLRSRVFFEPKPA